MRHDVDDHGAVAAGAAAAAVGFDVDFAGYEGTFQVWGSARDRVDGYGNAVSPPVGWWISNRLRAVLHNEEVAA